MNRDVELKNLRNTAEAEALNVASLYKAAEVEPDDGTAHLYRLEAMFREFYLDELDEQVKELERGCDQN